jgi:hypothetical protein
VSGAARKWAVEPGKFTLMAGGNFVDDLSTVFFLKQLASLQRKENS